MQFPANSFRYFQFEPSNVSTHFGIMQTFGYYTRAPVLTYLTFAIQRYIVLFILSLLDLKWRRFAANYGLPDFAPSVSGSIQNRTGVTRNRRDSTNVSFERIQFS